VTRRCTDYGGGKPLWQGGAIAYSIDIAKNDGLCFAQEKYSRINASVRQRVQWGRTLDWEAGKH
jgi:hypothetical protein